MAKARVVFLQRLPEKIVDVVLSHNPDGFTTSLLDGGLSEGEQKSAVAEADFILHFGTPVHDDVLRAAGKAKLVQMMAAGYDEMNLELMSELGIPCANNGGANSWAVSDHTLMLMLALNKKLALGERSVRDGSWNRSVGRLNTYEMAGKLVGLVGIGNIGRQVARRVQAFDALVQYHDVYPLDEEREKELNVTRVGLDELFRTSDIVSLHTPLTAETRHLVNRERIATMKSTALLINTARGPVVDEAALIEGLQAGRIAGAGLDVFEQEPIDPANPLLAMDNVVLTPHIAGITWDTWSRRARFAYANMQRVWRGETPQAVAG
jgi:phosphoglycerate dehydrogenase-like enzyme